MGLPAPQKKYDRLRQVLAETRKEAGVTQEELAARLGRPQTFVSKIERGVRGVDLLEFLEILRALGADPNTVIKRIEQG